MTSDKLWEAAKNTVVNEEEKKALAERLKKADKEFEAHSRSKLVTDAFLARAYSL